MMLMDPLSNVLSLLKPRNYVFGGFDLGPRATMSFPKHGGVKCYALASGSGSLVLETEPLPISLTRGDCFLLPRGVPFRLSGAHGGPAVDCRPIIAARPNGGIAKVGDGGGCLVVGGHIALDGRLADFLLGMLPPVVLIHGDDDKQALLWFLERLGLEMHEARPGAYLMAQHLAQMLLVQALRLHATDATAGRAGWLSALADRQIGPVISALHAGPARRWSVEALAELAGMSRSSFALRFKEVVGVAPMDYLTRWRMVLGASRLVERDASVSTIAHSLGYDSRKAFGTAFKRVMGSAPGRYALSARKGPRIDVQGSPPIVPDDREPFAEKQG